MQVLSNDCFISIPCSLKMTDIQMIQNLKRTLWCCYFNEKILGKIYLPSPIIKFRVIKGLTTKFTDKKQYFTGGKYQFLKRCLVKEVFLFVILPLFIISLAPKHALTPYLKKTQQQTWWKESFSRCRESGIWSSSFMSVVVPLVAMVPSLLLSFAFWKTPSIP